MGVSAEERIRQLIEAEDSKRKEIDQKKAELEKKKKEVEELESAGKKQIAQARKKLDEEIEELVSAEKRSFEESESARIKRDEQGQASLEETVGPTSSAQAPSQMRAYGEAIEHVLRGSPGFYDLTNYNVMNRLESLAAEAASRPLTKAEQEFVGIVEYHARSLANVESYQEREGSAYIRQELSRIDFINKMAKKNSDYNLNNNR